MKIAVAMSGGVDSSTAAALLVKKGHQVIGLTAKILLCAEMDGCQPRYDVCCSPESIHDAAKVAKHLHIPHYIVNVEDEFSQRVIEPFCREYIKGRTPSPCINCNTYIKFPKLLEIAKELGCDVLATGHYASLHKNSRFYITRGVDSDKDQSYFLFNLSQDILSQLILPLGSYTKHEIRKMAQEMKLPTAHRPESQEVCFVQDNDYPRFIEQRLGYTPLKGDIVTIDGRVIGTHNGIHRYTIGQRRGLGIAWEHPLYVVAIDAVNNRIIVGNKAQLLAKGLVATQINFMKVTFANNTPVWIKTRSTQKPFKALATYENNALTVTFESPQASITPGQAVVCYDDTGAICFGGWIERGL
ncbi:MAG: tRNA 2-thiouridine(34) synthase MnmA [Spirochaetes bacterium]|nr:tRNA 2-thiouridine(34) synthase MnmA [Spirochaetota bacterium]